MAPDRRTLKDGTAVALRPIGPEDRDALRSAFERLSPESRYRRFFSPIDQLSERQLDFLTRIDHRDHEALVAVEEETGHIVGVARYVRTGPAEAEPAIVVADDWHGRGVASLLLRRLVERAFEEGVDTFVAAVLAGNGEAVAVLRRLGDTMVRRQGTELELRIALNPPAAPEQPLRALLRAAATGALDPALTLWHRLMARTGEPSAPGDVRENVVVTALDGSEDAVVELTRSVAGASRAEVVVVAARHPLDDRAIVERRAGQVASRLRGHGLKVRHEVRTGDLGAVALDIAREVRARLIVVEDPPGAGPAGRLLGEPWDHISHHAPCSVLVARG